LECTGSAFICRRILTFNVSCRKKHEAHINTFPQFKTKVQDKLGEFDVHFAALFSEKKDAIPILLLHGWPGMDFEIQTSATSTTANFGIGSFIEFIPMMSILRERYTPETLPYHFVVPSLPGYTFSSPQPLDQDFSPVEAARVMDTLAKDLGFGDGYLVQGGDVGSRVARNMGVAFETCKGISSIA
jgi:microsomal epoxide hydrolase